MDSNKISSCRERAFKSISIVRKITRIPLRSTVRLFHFETVSSQTHCGSDQVPCQSTRAGFRLLKLKSRGVLVVSYLVAPSKSAALTACKRPPTAERKTANTQKCLRKKSTVHALVFCDKSEVFPFPITRDTVFEKILYRLPYAFGVLTIYVL